MTKLAPTLNMSYLNNVQFQFSDVELNLTAIGESMNDTCYYSTNGNFQPMPM